jgi:hypothetical protein
MIAVIHPFLAHTSHIPLARILPYFFCFPVLSTKLIILFVGIFERTAFLLVLFGTITGRFGIN